MVEAAAIPEGPRGSAADVTFRWLARPYALLDDAAARFGDTFTLRFARFGTHVVVAHPEDVRRVFAADREVLLAGHGNAPLAPILGSRSLLLTDGAPHAADRVLLHGAFRPERLRRWAATIEDEARRAAEGWGRDAAIDAYATALAVARSSILRTVCGVSRTASDALAKRVAALMAVVETNASFGNPAADGPLERRFRAARADLLDALDAHVDARRHDPTAPDDLVTDLAAAGFANDVIRDHLLTIILAGHETTAAAIAWALVELAATPVTQARLMDAPWLEAVSLEALRLHPPIPVVSRLVAAPFALRDWVLPPGVHVTPCAYLAHRRTTHFSDPTAFRPERFLDTRVPAHVYFPFGGGVRRCIGMGLAMLEMTTVLRVWAHGRRFALEGTPRPTRRAVTIVPGGRWRLRVTTP